MRSSHIINSYYAFLKCYDIKIGHAKILLRSQAIYFFMMFCTMVPSTEERAMVIGADGDLNLIDLTRTKLTTRCQALLENLCPFSHRALQLFKEEGISHSFYL